MPQPEYVPHALDDKVRDSERLPVPDTWRAVRPGEVVTNGGQPTGDGFGVQGPDQGYALKLARSLTPRLELDRGEDADDVLAGCLGIALRRAALFGRAPILYDLELAVGLFGFLEDAPPRDLVEFRKPLFQAAGHHYEDQRRIVDLVPDSTLRLTPGEVRSRLEDWRTLLDAT